MRKILLVFALALLMASFSLAAGASEECDISYIVAKDIALDKNVEISFACSPSSSVLIIFLDYNGAQLGGPFSISSCSASGAVFTGYALPQGAPSGTYVAQIFDSKCTKATYFSAYGSESQRAVAVPDSSPIAALAAALAALAMIVFRKRSK